MLLAMREAADAGHLKIVDGGLLEFKPRHDGQLTIYTIVSTKPGVGSKLFDWLLEYAAANKVQFIQAKCPTDLESNGWYRHKGFELTNVETTKRSGRKLNVWRFPIKRRELF